MAVPFNTVNHDALRRLQVRITGKLDEYMEMMVDIIDDENDLEKAATRTLLEARCVYTSYLINAIDYTINNDPVIKTQLIELYYHFKEYLDYFDSRYNDVINELEYASDLASPALEHEENYLSAHLAEVNKLHDNINIALNPLKN